MAGGELRRAGLGRPGGRNERCSGGPGASAIRTFSAVASGALRISEAVTGRTRHFNTTSSWFLRWSSSQSCREE